LVPAQGAVISGGSSLLSQADANQLEAWLGEGPIEITRIYEKHAGDTASDFHAASDNKGRTFSLIEVLPGTVTTYSFKASDLDTVSSSYGSYWYDDNGQSHYATQYNGTSQIAGQIIGGYNPQSWTSDGTYAITNNNVDRTAFLFNLTSSEVQRQNLIGQGESGSGSYQAADYPAGGPIFGGGYDLGVSAHLNYGLSNNYSYGGTSIYDDILTGGARYHYDFSIGRIEVFTIAEAEAAVPEPATLTIWSLGTLSCVVAALRRKRLQS
jgi:hypothetical protein